MLMAIGTGGELYCALTQVNTDHKIFCLFMSRLAEKLKKEDPGALANTVVLCDGARYQSCAKSMSHMRALWFRVCISTPYSFPGQLSSWLSATSSRWT